MKNTFKDILIFIIITIAIVTGLKFTAISYINHHPEIAEMQVISHSYPRPREVYITISAHTVKIKKPLDN